MITFTESIIYLVIFFSVILQFAHVFVSPRSYGRAKFGWLVAVLVFPVAAYVAFLLFTSQAKVEQDGW